VGVVAAADAAFVLHFAGADLSVAAGFLERERDYTGELRLRFSLWFPGKTVNYRLKINNWTF